MTRNARTKKRTRQRAQRDDVAYCTARYEAKAPELPGPLWLGPDIDLPERPGPDQLLRQDVEDWCNDHINRPLDDLSTDLAVLLDLPGEFEDPTVQQLEVDLDTIESQVVDRYESGTLALAGTAQATLSVEGVMLRPDAHDAENQGWVQVIGDRNERHVEVLFDSDVDVEVEFTALADLTNRRVESFDADARYVGTA